MTINGQEIGKKFINTVVTTLAGLITVGVVTSFLVPYNKSKSNEKRIDKVEATQEKTKEINAIQYQIVIDKLNEIKEHNDEVKQELKEIREAQ